MEEECVGGDVDISELLAVQELMVAFLDSAQIASRRVPLLT